eukprot:gnl/MRDRNA2_/MRDRNA2_27425_c0_seq1.p1 gnl/MRDRNA2_/MRDRNA2_27425_c0~~gnl/MRDRNA2_/MRDRNA2_27425_c0_seq1.p1  ORF type:complete len:364 (-),score=75.11 gnl/MRDRNA2_/MRDRNA2_27425_c0_seq1:51-1142(-)
MGCILTTTNPAGNAVLKSKYFPEFRQGLPSMTGKVVAITGCTSGTGRICAKTLAELGAKVVMLNRASERADEALNDLKTVALEKGAPPPVLIPCDLVSFKSVIAAGEKMNAELGSSGLDVLCNNAGIMGFGDEATEDGCDIQMQTNHTAHFLLTNLCMPLLEKAATSKGEARIVNHSSAARKMDGMENKLDPKYIDKNGGNLGGSSATLFKGANFQRYQQTKLANVVFTYALDEKLKSKGLPIKALVAHPGVAPTMLTNGTIKNGGAADLGSAPQCVQNLVQYAIMHSEQDATMGILRCCCDPAVKSREFYGPPGKLEDSEKHDQSEYKGKAELKKEEKLADQQAQKELWEMSEKVTGRPFKI